MDELSIYEPSQKMLDALEAGWSEKSLTEADATFGLYLKSRILDYDNVCTVLGMLISIEDISSMQPYSQLIQSDVIVSVEHQDTFSIMTNKTTINVKDVLTPNMDEIVLIPRGFRAISGILALMPHISEQSHCGSSDHRHVAEITSVSHKKVTFQFKINEETGKYEHCIPHFLKTNIRYDVIFRAPRIPIRLMHHALDVLQKNSNLRRYLFPIVDLDKQPTPVSNKLSTLSLYNSSIRTNDEQLQAVNQIVAGPNPRAPYIVFGPPGTGKTTTIVEAILQLYRQGNRILVTAGSNSACDTIALRLYECLELHGLETEHLRRVYATSYSKHKKPVLLKKNSMCISNKSLEEGYLSSYKIIVATLCSVGRIFTCSSSNRFTHVFIDEAAASTEAEALMGVVFKDALSSCHVILSGDHKQLGAVIKNDRVASLGLGESLMERLLAHKLYEVDKSGNYDQTLQTRLRRNYRSHPEIVGIYNKLYYNGELIPLAPLDQVSQAANWSVLPNGKFPILFQEASGSTQRENHSTSSFNDLEANIVCWMVLKLLCDGLGNGHKVKQEDIGIITPYLAQCKVINRKLRDRHQNNVEVGSVESYQGREKTIIIASMVSSFKSTHFLSNPRRVNVLLSRAKSLMILIGNPVTLSKNKDFKFIIDQCRENGNLLSQQQVEDDIKKTDNAKTDANNGLSALERQLVKLNINR
ncbi:hypothetical protein ACLKA7_000345 [Drosophila subpalustris]